MKGNKLLELFSPGRIILPVTIGLGVLVFLFIKNFKKEDFTALEWSWYSLWWLFAAVAMMVVRQFFYMYRIRILANSQLSWRASFEVILLWEFVSAATPSSVGGTAGALFLLSKEKINAGKTAAIVMCTIFLDMIFLLGAFFLFLVLLGGYVLFPESPVEINFIIEMKGWVYYFVLTLGILTLYTLLVTYGLFLNPSALKSLMVKIMSVRFLSKWRWKAEKTGDELIIASSEMIGKGAAFWAQTFLATVMTWTGRFLVLSCLIMAIIPFHEHLVLYARQLALMIMLMMSPTPGGSGVAELSFSAFVADLIPYGLVASIAFLWRLFTYYPYLFLGLIILPRWVRRVFERQMVPESMLNEG